jgi:LacI family transcriptional regulator
MFLTSDWNCAAFGRWIERQRPDVVITIGPTVGTWLKELGLRVPRDIGLANVDVALDTPGTTGIDQSPRIIGAAAIDLLISLIHHHERGVPAVPRVTKVQGTFFAGKTTRPQVEVCADETARTQ